MKPTKGYTTGSRSIWNPWNHMRRTHSRINTLGQHYRAQLDSGRIRSVCIFTLEASRKSRRPDTAVTRTKMYAAQKQPHTPQCRGQPPRRSPWCNPPSMNRWQWKRALAIVPIAKARIQRRAPGQGLLAIIAVILRAANNVCQRITSVLSSALRQYRPGKGRGRVCWIARYQIRPTACAAAHCLWTGQTDHQHFPGDVCLSPVGRSMEIGQ